MGATLQIKISHVTVVEHVACKGLTHVLAQLKHVVEVLGGEGGLACLGRVALLARRPGAARAPFVSL